MHDWAEFYVEPWGWLPAAFGLLFVVGRVVYMQLYMGDPAKRGPGTALGGVAELALLILSIVGIVQAWGAETAG